MAKTKTSKPVKPTPPPYPRVYELFDDFDYELNRANSLPKVPRVGNGSVSLRRYRITVELIEEPKEVLVERLHKLWRGTRNHHDADTLLPYAKRFGIELDHNEFGADVKKQ